MIVSGFNLEFRLGLGLQLGFELEFDLELEMGVGLGVTLELGFGLIFRLRSWSKLKKKYELWKVKKIIIIFWLNLVFW